MSSLRKIYILLQSFKILAPANTRFQIHLQNISTAMLQVSSRKKQRAQETVPVLSTIIMVQNKESCCIPTPIATVKNHFRMAFHPYSLEH